MDALCLVFGVAPSCFYYFLKHKDKKCSEREALKEKMVASHAQSRGTMGTRRHAKKLQQQGNHVGRYKARRLMKEAGLVSHYPKKHAYKTANLASKIAPNFLKRTYAVDRPNKFWCGDVTYIWAGTEWVYLAVVLDLYSRRIVGWACSNSPNSDLTCAALHVAFDGRGQPKNVMFHSDQGTHYSSKQYCTLLNEYKIKQSMSRRGNCWDNVVIERFFRSYKSEWMPKRGYSSVKEAQEDALKYIHSYYNPVRLHSYNDYMTPMAKEAAY